MSVPLPPVPTNGSPFDAARRIPAQRKLLAGVVLAAVIGLIVAATRFGGGPQFVPLFRNLEMESVGGITDALTKGGIQYQLAAGGSEVQVRPDDAARARVLLASNGLPANGRPGLELFDKPTWGMTDFTQRITYRRALEGELARTIGEIRGVERARVHLALPESSPLRRLDRSAEAAVVLTLKPTAMLGPEQVQGIAYIVSNAVEQLPSENVAVMDESGRILSAPADAGMVGLTTRQMDMQRTVETQLSRKAEELLATVVGNGNARVQVAASLNFDQAEKTIEAYDPDKQVLSTEQRSETGADPAAGTGAQTVISNQYSNSRTVERVVGSVGTVKKMTVAVLVDEAAISREATRIGTTQDAQLAALETVIRDGLGVDSIRGDRITVAAMSFDASARQAVATIADTTTPKRDVIVLVEKFSKPGLILVGLIVALVLGLRILKPAAAAAPAAASAGTAAALPRQDAGDTGALNAAEQQAVLDAVNNNPLIAAPVSSESRLLREAVAREAASETETVAQVIRAWLGER
jgi:flagellar M-ring protein FliF